MPQYQLLPHLSIAPLKNVSRKKEWLCPIPHNRPAGHPCGFCNSQRQTHSAENDILRLPQTSVPRLQIRFEPPSGVIHALPFCFQNPSTAQTKHTGGTDTWHRKHFLFRIHSGLQIRTGI